MGCCFSSEHPKEEQYRRAKDYDTKAKIILAIASDWESQGYYVEAIVSYGEHLRCMAVHVFKEFDRRKKDEMLNLAQSCRRIATHRATLEKKAIRQAQQSCCGSEPIITDPPAPTFLKPWEWNEWLAMCKGSGDIEAALKKMGLIKMETKETAALRLAEAGRSSVNVALTQQCNPNISVAGPTTTISGPTTTTSVNPNISGPTTTVNPSIVSSNAQTGEGNVAPSVGAVGAAGAVGAGGPAGGTAAPPQQPLAPQLAHMGSGYFMMPTPQGMMMVPAGSGSGDYGAAMGAMMQQQQALMMQQPMMMPVGGMMQQMQQPTQQQPMMQPQFYGQHMMQPMQQPMMVPAGMPWGGMPSAGAAFPPTAPPQPEKASAAAESAPPPAPAVGVPLTKAVVG